MTHAAHPLLQALSDWSRDYAKDDAWIEDCPSRSDERRIVDLAAAYPEHGELPPGTTHLYRGQGVSDEDVAELLSGVATTPDITRRAFASWSIDEAVARRFASDAADGGMSSAVVLRVAIDRLDVVCVIPKEIGLREMEVLVRNEPLLVEPSEVVGAWVYDDDHEISAEIDLSTVANDCRHTPSAPVLV